MRIGRLRIGRLRFGWPRSLILRILLVEFVAIGGAALILPLLLVAVLDRTSARYQDRALLDQARAIAIGLRVAGPEGSRLVAADAIQPAFTSTYDGRAFVVLDAAGRVRLASRYAGAVRWRVAPRRAVEAAFRAPPFVGASVPATIGGRPFWIVVSQDETRPGAILDDVRRVFPSRYLGVLLPVLLLLPLMNSLLIRRLVRVVLGVSDEAAAIGAQTLDARLPTRDLPAEVAPLVHATNALLARLEGSFARQAEFVGNVVHELRTPLATLRLAADAVADEGARARLAAQVDRLSHVVGQLHDLAALEAPRLPAGERFDLADLARETLVELAGEALAQGHAIELIAPDDPAPVAGHRVLIGLALANLVTNAVRHTPAGTRVTVIVAAEADGAALRVEDDGPGIAGWAPDQLTRRYWRADHRRSDSAGLGLAIVERICTVHGARLALGASADGGAAFAIRLPRPDAPSDN